MGVTGMGAHRWGRPESADARRGCKAARGAPRPPRRARPPAASLWPPRRRARAAIPFGLAPAGGAAYLRIMPDSGFIHLRVHSEYSVLEGAVRVKSLPGMAAEAGMPAVALTDTNAMFAALEFSEGAAKRGVQPIMGVQIDMEYEAAAPGAKAISPAPIVLLAQSEAGYANLLLLQSRLYLAETHREPQVTPADLAARSEGLICLSGGPDGPVGRLLRTGRRAMAEALLERLAEIYPGRLYVELQRHPGEDGLPEAEALTERGHVEMAYAMGLPLVATNDVHFPAADMFEAHDALLCIAEGAYVDQNEPRRQLTPEHWFKPADAMRALFADLPEACENTVEIARRCAFRPATRAPILPRFAEDEVDELRRQAREGLAARLEVIPHAALVAEYEARLEFELGVIERMGYPGYFLIVADFIQWAKGQRIPVGPGRGSGAGSLVAYALTITDLDPLRYSLLFERFLNPDRVSMPDFDIDFCMDRREEVIRYVQERYGRERVGQIITFGALLSKAAVRDVGRVLQMPYMQCDALSKMVPLEGVKPVPIPQALRMEPRLAEEARKPVVGRLLDYCAKLEGLLRNASTHAAGVVIGDRPLDQLVPLYRDPRAELPATQFNMKWVEQAGLVKFDFLGLKTLTMIRNALDLLEARGAPVDLDRIPLDDERAYALYASGKTTAVFQVESSGMIDALRRMRPTCIEDIVALGRSLPPRPDGEHPPVLRRQERAPAPRAPAPLDRPHPRRDAGHHRLPGAGDGDRPRDGGLFPRRARTSCAAPWARRSRPRWTRSGPCSSKGRRPAACPRPRRWRSGTSSTSSPTTASTSPTPRPTGSSATRPPGSRPTTRSSSWPAS